MNRPDKAGEPSMEEILASIRQIIAEDPAPDRDTPAVEPNPLVPQSAAGDRKGGAAQAGEVRTPTVDRLTDVLKSGPLPPTSPLGSKRPLSFDQDLADMFDEPGAAGAGPVPTPKPDLRVPMELSASVTQPVTPPAADVAPLFTPKPFMSAFASGAGTSPPQAAATEPAATPPPPFGSAGPRPAEPLATPPPARSFGFPPLRKESFYPPQPKTPELSLPAKPAVPAAEDGPAPAAAASAAAGNGSLDAAIERLSGLGAVVPGASVASGASGSPAPVNGGESAGGLRIRDLGTMPDLSVPDLAAPEPKIAPDALASAASAVPRSEPAALDPPSPDPVPAPGLAGALGGAPQQDVAAQALDALAQGLAASAAASVMGPAAGEAAIALTPVADLSVARAGMVAAPQAPAAQQQQASQGRTLEDAVADMLRPMLQQWVAENMPRIIEKALRVEVAKTMKPGSPSSSGT